MNTGIHIYMYVIVCVYDFIPNKSLSLSLTHTHTENAYTENLIDMLRYMSPSNLPNVDVKTSYSSSDDILL